MDIFYQNNSDIDHIPNGQLAFMPESSTLTSQGMSAARTTLRLSWHRCKLHNLSKGPDSGE